MDPTYRQEEINSNPVWELAFVLSEIMNDNAPVGWSNYIGPAGYLLSNYEMKRKPNKRVLTEE
jgi:hypothetical protein